MIKAKRDIPKYNKIGCGMCGATRSDPDPYNPGRKIHLEIDYLLSVDNSYRVLCSNCSEGRKNLVVSPGPSFPRIIRRIHGLPPDQQRWIFKTLQLDLEARR